MDPSNGKTSETERRTSIRRSVRASADDDDLALAAMGISDGFRPSQSLENLPSSGAETLSNAATRESQPRPCPGQNADAPAAQMQPPRPSSIAKTRQNDSFSLRHDGAIDPVNDRGLPRNSTLSGDNPFVAPNESPYTGPSGPSFPYQMYPQNVRSNRTDSVATASTAAPAAERSYNGPRGPTYPYGMYPQSTTADADTMEVTPQGIPVGFPGTTDQYRRRVGPDGEEAADLIGPDGHTEELPPYTRYPEETYARKVRDAGQPLGATAAPVQPIPAQPAMQVQDPATSAQPQPQPSTTTTAAAVPAPIPGAGGMGLATRNPEFSTSTDDLSSPRSRYSAQSFGSHASSHQINAAAATVSEKPKPRWKQKAEKKLWGIIPYWAICLVFSALILMGVILGAVIGTFLAKHDEPPPKKDHESDETAFPATVTVTLDATPLSTVPADLRALEEGDFALPIVSAARSSKSCFNNTLQSNAWSCNIVFSELMMSITHLKGNPPTSSYAVNLSCNKSFTLDKGTYSYGTQPPCFNENHTMDLVTDIYEPNRGPAWFFQMPYEKVVILPESFLSLDDETSGESDEVFLREKKKRFGSSDGDKFGDGSFKRKGVANPGEKPWICSWDGTMLEVFVYANQDSNGYRQYTSMSALGSSYLATATENPFRPPTPSTPTPTPSSNTQASNGGVEGAVSIEGSEATTTVTATTTITNPVGSETEDPSASTTYGQWKFDGPKLPPAPYPRVVKIEERRMNGPPSKVPVCQQFEILEDGKRPALDAFGKEIKIEIGETEPDPTLVDADDIFPKPTSDVEAEEKIRKRHARIDPRVFEERTGGAYYLDEGHLIERSPDAILVGQDLSNCGCLWWTL